MTKLQKLSSEMMRNKQEVFNEFAAVINMKNELFKGHFSEERKVLNRTQDFLQGAINPKQKAISIVKQKFLEILKGAGMERG